MVGVLHILAQETGGVDAAAKAPNWFMTHAYIIPMLCVASNYEDNEVLAISTTTDQKFWAGTSAGMRSW